MASKAKVLLIPSTSKRYGGDLYEEEVVQVISSEFDVNMKQVIPSTAKTNHLLAVPKYFHNLYDLKHEQAAVTIRSMNNPFFLANNTKNVVIAYHYDTRFCHPLVRVHAHLTYLSMYRQRHKIDRLVVISDFWADYFRARGFERITIIRSAVDPKEFVVSKEEVEAVKTKYGLHGKKVIYVGNPLRKKGTDKVAAVLKDKGYLLVATGNSDTELPALTLKLEFREYAALINSIGLAITMSQFNEGWCRQAHEAMLCGVPVIGSGFGGMKELLDAGGQPVCTDFDLLPELVEKTYGDKALGEKGRVAALKYSATTFSEDWLQVIRDLSSY